MNALSPQPIGHQSFTVQIECRNSPEPQQADALGNQSSQFRQQSRARSHISHGPRHGLVSFHSGIKNRLLGLNLHLQAIVLVGQRLQRLSFLTQTRLTEPKPTAAQQQQQGQGRSKQRPLSGECEQECWLDVGSQSGHDAA